MESSGFKPKENSGDKIRLYTPFFLGVSFFCLFLMNDYNLFLPHLSKYCCIVSLTRQTEGTGLFRRQ